MYTYKDFNAPQEEMYLLMMGKRSVILNTLILLMESSKFSLLKPKSAL